MTRNDFEIKPAIISNECLEMPNEAVAYLKDKALAPTQAEIMNSQFFAAIRQLEVTPWIGTPYKDGMRNVKLAPTAPPPYAISNHSASSGHGDTLGLI